MLASPKTDSEMTKVFLTFATSNTRRSTGAGFRTGQTNVNVVVFRERAEEWIHAPSAFAVTTLTYCENLEGQCEFLGQIRDADIEINGAYFDFSAEISGQPPRVDLENTLTH